jgi:hypothetical protein
VVGGVVVVVIGTVIEGLALRLVVDCVEWMVWESLIEGRVGIVGIVDTVDTVGIVADDGALGAIDGVSVWLEVPLVLGVEWVMGLCIIGDGLEGGLKWDCGGEGTMFIILDIGVDGNVGRL